MKSAYIGIDGEINASLNSVLFKNIDNFRKQGVESIDIGINSFGGSSEAGVVAYNYLQSLQTNIKINTINLYNCHSAAILYYLSGNKKYAFDNSIFIIHQGKVGLNGAYNIGDLEREIQVLKNINENYFDIVKKHFIISEEEYYNEQIIRTKEFDVESDGFIDEVINKLDKNYDYRINIVSKNNQILID